MTRTVLDYPSLRDRSSWFGEFWATAFFDTMDLMDCMYFLNTINDGLSSGDALVDKDTREFGTLLPR